MTSTRTKVMTEGAPMRKAFLAAFLCVCLALLGCGRSELDNVSVERESADSSEQAQYAALDDERLLGDIETAAYESIVEELSDKGYLVEDVQAAYLSKEYIEELAFNSKENVFFGYTLAEIDELFTGQRYVFYPGEDGQTEVKAFEAYDGTYHKAIRDVAIGTGVVLVCVTVSVAASAISAPVASTVSIIFAASAKASAVGALTGAAFGSACSGILAAIETGDSEQALKAFASGAADGYKWGAISGAAIGGVGEAIQFKRAVDSGLSLNQAVIQRKSKYPVEVVKSIRNADEYSIYEKANLVPEEINGKSALVRKIDLKYVDPDGRTNLERMQMGKPPLDSNGVAYEVHHIGQKDDSPLAILTQAEHRSAGNNKILHPNRELSEINRTAFEKTKKEFWKEMASSAF